MQTYRSLWRPWGRSTWPAALDFCGQRAGGGSYSLRIRYPESTLHLLLCLRGGFMEPSLSSSPRNTTETRTCPSCYSSLHPCQLPHEELWRRQQPVPRKRSNKTRPQAGSSFASGAASFPSSRHFIPQFSIIKITSHRQHNKYKCETLRIIHMWQTHTKWPNVVGNMVPKTCSTQDCHKPSV